MLGPFSFLCGLAISHLTQLPCCKICTTSGHCHTLYLPVYGYTSIESFISMGRTICWPPGVPFTSNILSANHLAFQFCKSGGLLLVSGLLSPLLLWPWSLSHHHSHPQLFIFPGWSLLHIASRIVCTHFNIHGSCTSTQKCASLAHKCFICNANHAATHSYLYTPSAWPMNPSESPKWEQISAIRACVGHHLELELELEPPRLMHTSFKQCLTTNFWSQGSQCDSKVLHSPVSIFLLQTPCCAQSCGIF